jgi:hypothetical protein
MRWLLLVPAYAFGGVCSEEALYQVLSSVGQHILDMRVIKDKFTGAPRSAPGIGGSSEESPCCQRKCVYSKEHLVMKGTLVQS